MTNNSIYGQYALLNLPGIYVVCCTYNRELSEVNIIARPYL